MKRTVPLFVISVILTTPVHGQDSWPTAFNLVCGDRTPQRGSMVLDFAAPLAFTVLEGTATRIPAAELTGAKNAGGLGYRVEARLTEQELTGSPSPVMVSLHCVSLNPVPVMTAKLECNSSRRIDIVEGFNLLKATMPVPGPSFLAGQAEGTGTVTIRRQKADTSFTPPLNIYYQTVREIAACRLRP